MNSYWNETRTGMIQDRSVCDHKPRFSMKVTNIPCFVIQILTHCGNFSLESSECDHHDLPRPPGAAVPLLYPTATTFHPVDPRCTSQAHNSIGTSNVLRDITDPNSSLFSEQAIGAILTMQQQQNQQVIATHQQLAAAAEVRGSQPRSATM